MNMSLKEGNCLAAPVLVSGGGHEAKGGKIIEPEVAGDSKEIASSRHNGGDVQMKSQRLVQDVQDQRVFDSRETWVPVPSR